MDCGTTGVFLFNLKHRAREKSRGGTRVRVRLENPYSDGMSFLVAFSTNMKTRSVLLFCSFLFITVEVWLM